jgi:hypothetical protein
MLLNNEVDALRKLASLRHIEICFLCSEIENLKIDAGSEYVTFFVEHWLRARSPGVRIPE